MHRSGVGRRRSHPLAKAQGVDSPPMLAEMISRGIGQVLSGRPLPHRLPDTATGHSHSRLGEHTDQALAEVFGLSDAESGRLHDRRFVCGTT